MDKDSMTLYQFIAIDEIKQKEAKSIQNNNFQLSMKKVFHFLALVLIVTAIKAQQPS